MHAYNVLIEEDNMNVEKMSKEEHANVIGIYDKTGLYKAKSGNVTK